MGLMGSGSGEKKKGPILLWNASIKILKKRAKNLNNDYLYLFHNNERERDSPTVLTIIQHCDASISKMNSQKYLLVSRHKHPYFGLSHIDWISASGWNQRDSGLEPYERGIIPTGFVSSWTLITRSVLGFDKLVTRKKATFLQICIAKCVFNWPKYIYFVDIS